MTAEPQEADIRPIVRTPRRGLSNAMIVALAVVGAVLLFATLEARRQRASAPATKARSAEVVAGSSVPPLYVPPELSQPMPTMVAQPPVPSATPVPQASLPVVVSRPSVSEPLPPFQPYPVSPPPVPQRPARTAGGPALVLDNTGATGSPAPVPAEGGAVGTGTQGEQRSLSTARARAAVLANRGTTVPQGTMIPAVLETAFDSTHAGFARALVQRDVRGFDGTQTLIPRGSRLIGEYSEDTAQGQRRAIIMWTRLIRPDGVTVAIGSPAVDTVGRGGVKADVNTHFLERFSGAILQSSLDLGIGLAARSARSPVLIALPGSVAGVGRSGAQPADIKPTLRVPAGRSVSIFVARDLDFTGMDAIR